MACDLFLYLLYLRQQGPLSPLLSVGPSHYHSVHYHYCLATVGTLLGVHVVFVVVVVVVWYDYEMFSVVSISCSLDRCSLRWGW